MRMVTEGGRTVLSVANDCEVHENTMLKWKRQYRVYSELANEVEFPKSVRILHRTPAVKYAMIKRHAGKLDCGTPITESISWKYCE